MFYINFSNITAISNSGDCPSTAAFQFIHFSLFRHNKKKQKSSGLVWKYLSKMNRLNGECVLMNHVSFRGFELKIEALI